MDDGGRTMSATFTELVPVFVGNKGDIRPSGQMAAGHYNHLEIFGKRRNCNLVAVLASPLRLRPQGDSRMLRRSTLGAPSAFFYGRIKQK